MRRRCPLSAATLCHLLSACAGGEVSEQPPDTTGQVELLAALPDRATADCTGTLAFISSRRFEGRSTCGAGFQGFAKNSLPIGTQCVFSASEQGRRAGIVLSSGHFACSDGSRGTVNFEAMLHGSSGNAVATTEDGRVVTLYYI